jgi:hypothetical protein
VLSTEILGAPSFQKLRLHRTDRVREFSGYIRANSWFSGCLFRCDLSSGVNCQSANFELLAGWTLRELLEHAVEEHARDVAEGVRIAYVAATRARDLLVVPAIGDDPTSGGGPGMSAEWWVAPLYAAMYPPAKRRRQPSVAR